MVTLTIDGKTVQVPAGSTILDAARTLGLSIPTLCHLPGVKENRPSCLACVVRLGDDPKVVPSCSTLATEGLVVHSESPDVKALRKAALELLFSDHLGDCVSICQRVCPARLPIPATIRLVAAGEMAKAVALVKDVVPFPGVLGRICRAPCEKGCRRAKHDGAVEIKTIEREVADADRAAPTPYRPAVAAATGKRIAIVGAGLTGLSAAYHLARAGHACSLFDDQSEPGGSVRAAVSAGALPSEILAAEYAVVAGLGVEFRGGVRLGRDLNLAELKSAHDAVLLCVGDVQKAGGTLLGVDATPRGIRVDPSTLMTNVPGVFAAGACVRGGNDPARSVGDGTVLAECVDAVLRGGRPDAARKLFSSTIPRLDEEEHAQIELGSNASLAVRDLTDLAARAAGRCWHCDCRAATDCRLRIFSSAYGVNVAAFAGPHRRRFQFIRQPAGVIFEPGKCISCGICVELAARAKVPLGFTFIGRGFDVKVGTPLSGPVADGLRDVAESCVRHCPTGAIAFEDEARNARVRAGAHPRMAESVDKESACSD